MYGFSGGVEQLENVKNRALMAEKKSCHLPKKIQGNSVS